MSDVTVPVWVLLLVLLSVSQTTFGLMRSRRLRVLTKRAAETIELLQKQQDLERAKMEAYQKLFSAVWEVDERGELDDGIAAALRECIAACGDCARGLVEVGECITGEPAPEHVRRALGLLPRNVN